MKQSASLVKKKEKLQHEYNHFETERQMFRSMMEQMYKMLKYLEQEKMWI